VAGERGVEVELRRARRPGCATSPAREHLEALEQHLGARCGRGSRRGRTTTSRPSAPRWRAASSIAYVLPTAGGTSRRRASAVPARAAASSSPREAQGTSRGRGDGLCRGSSWPLPFLRRGRSRARLSSSTFTRASPSTAGSWRSCDASEATSRSSSASGDTPGRATARPWAAPRPGRGVRCGSSPLAEARNQVRGTGPTRPEARRAVNALCEPWPRGRGSWAPDVRRRWKPAGL